MLYGTINLVNTDSLMPRCLMAPSHYLNQCWHINNRNQCLSPLSNFHMKCSRYKSVNGFENYTLKITVTIPMDQWVNLWSQLTSDADPKQPAALCCLRCGWGQIILPQIPTPLLIYTQPLCTGQEPWQWIHYYCCCCSTCHCSILAGLILGLHPANERWHYFVMPSLIGWVQT